MPVSLSSISAPLILTLRLDPAAQAHFDELRQRHFPPERNFLAAHVTLFHHLPGEEAPAITRFLTEWAANLAPLTLRVAGLRFLGRGVAYDLANDELLRRHRELQTAWAAWLTPQDQQRLRPHVTVQNKVAPDVARTLHTQLAADFQPFEVQATGVQLWAYRGGPWEALREVAFGQPAPATTTSNN
ncbi:2'-5' RNA ligase family protein [Hymenobacter weizhouensis]|uniref:2'-5' RNA ligase family protein n=1 Tax=Hymenobacter sp. YIM 151500-1 TaxID=2987689 RepID=UPI002227E0FF|nr:2'-5' RNA ligase family protein [Hymenobacter sp. YIM 151500-1]UYZ64680.1 2'-5' RNA ligase family protein [Hymenobacter sp. YIM 151500-1]